MSFAKKMIELRKQQDLSQQDLADRLGVSRQAISRWETGAVQPLADSVKSLAQVFQVSTDYLLNDDLDTPTPPPTAQPAPPQEKPKSARKHRKWLLALAALAAAAVLVLVTAAGTAYYLQWKERQPVSIYDMNRETAEESIRDRSVVMYSFDEW